MNACTINAHRHCVRVGRVAQFTTMSALLALAFSVVLALDDAAANFKLQEGATNAASVRVYVVTMDGVPGSGSHNQGRLNSMRSAWATQCPNNPVDIVVCPGVQHPIRGHGTTIAIAHCIDRAIEDGVEWPIFLEDDARLEDNAAEICQQRNFDDFARGVPTDALLVYMGSWCQFPADWVDPATLREKWPTAVKRQTWITPKGFQISFRHLLTSYGLYAWTAPKRNLVELRKHHFKYLTMTEPDLRGSFAEPLKPNNTALAPDLNAYQLAEDMGLRIYDTQPTLVYHAGGYSNTWKSRGHKVVGRWEKAWPLAGAAIDPLPTEAPPLEVVNGRIKTPRCSAFISRRRRRSSSNHSKM